MSGFPRLTRKEQTLVAVALLLPVPLVGLVGYSAVGPDRGGGLGSLATLHTADERRRVTAGDETAGIGSGGRRGTDGTLRIAASGGLVDRSGRPTPRVSDGGSPATEAAGRETAVQLPHESPNDDPSGDGGAGETPRAEPSASASGTLGTASSENGAPGVALTLSSPGSGVVIEVDGEGVRVGTADTADASSEQVTPAVADVTAPEGSATGAAVDVPVLTLP